MAKKKQARDVFTATVFAKRRDGVEHYGVIVREHFYPIIGVNPGDTVQLWEKYPTLEYFVDGHWRMLVGGFTV